MLHILRIAFSIDLLFLFALTFSSPGNAQDVTINIEGPGGGAQYIEMGATQQEPVEVLVGQTVRWQNNGNIDHTATAFTETSEIIFDTEAISDGGEHADVEMTREVFKKAGGIAGDRVTIEYVCDFHPRMSSSIILIDGEEGGVVGGENDESPHTEQLGLVIRRDITTLSPSELTAYRDAWRAIQTNGTFQEIAGYHGCPRNFCHRDANTFLAWHREYCLRMERALQAIDPTMALHYWDWTSPTSLSNGIPTQLTDRNYTSGGSQFRNPLRQSRFACGSPARFTSRNPRAVFFLASITSRAQACYDAVTFEDFDSRINGPHGSIHTWIRGDMISPTFAAYDPIFWAHHSNVDRQWASWQEAGGRAPNSRVSTFSLRGFTGRTVGSVVDFRSLGYEYDRYDSIAGVQELVAFRNEAGRTFEVEIPAALESLGEEDLELVVEGIPAHPKQSYMIHVFVGQPQATLADVKPDNKHYAGSFGIFGHSPVGVEAMPMDMKVDRSVADLAKKAREGLLRADGQVGNAEVTLLAENEQGNVVAFTDVPIEGVRIGKPKSQEANLESITPDSSTSVTLEGISRNESFSEAYKDAASKAQGFFGPDSLLNIEVIKVSGVRGGFSGLTNLKVTIKASLDSQ